MLEAAEEAAAVGVLGSAGQPDLAPGTAVVLRGVRFKPELNGAVGTVDGDVRQSGRVPVRLIAHAPGAHGTTIALKPSNLEPFAATTLGGKC